MGEVVYSPKHFARTQLQASDTSAALRAAGKIRLRARICPTILLTADTFAFVAATFLAFAVSLAQDTSPYTRAIANLTTLGAGWHGWGTLLVLVCLLGYFGGRGHYT